MKQSGFRQPTLEEVKAKQQEKRNRLAMKTTKPKARGNIRRWGTNLWNVHQADIRFSKWLRKKVGRCEKCFTTENLTCSHYIGRSQYATRFLEENCDVLCMKCHSEFEGKKTSDYKLWKINKMGQVAYDRLEALRYSYISVPESIFNCMNLVNK
jgi:hypothetical protein